MIYHPEMNEKPEPRLFDSRHNFRDSYSVSWPTDRDAEARAKLKELRIRPAFKAPIELGVPGEWSPATRLGKAVYHCLITGSSHSKLMDADITACEVLLD